MLPKGYELPAQTSSPQDGYMNKFEVGENRIRILSEIKTGFEWWVDAQGNGVVDRQIKKGDKPVRVRTFKEAVSDPQAGDYKHFWTMVIWNYAKSKMQILTIKQSKIQKGLDSLEKDADWGDTRRYDIVIKRTGEGFSDTTYEVIPKPMKPLDGRIHEEVVKNPIDLEKLFEGENPFGVTPEVVEAPEPAPIPKKEDALMSTSDVEDVTDDIPF